MSEKTMMKEVVKATVGAAKEMVEEIKQEAEERRQRQKEEEERLILLVSKFLTSKIEDVRVSAFQTIYSAGQAAIAVLPHCEAILESELKKKEAGQPQNVDLQSRAILLIGRILEIKRNPGFIQTKLSGI